MNIFIAFLFKRFNSHSYPNPYLIVTLSLSLFSCSDPVKKLAEDAPLLAKTYTDDLGRKFSLTESPQRIVSLAPSLTEMVFALGAGDRLVGRSQACNFPAEVQSVATIETYPQIAYEKAIALNPDIIVTTSEIHDDNEVKPFGDLGIPVVIQRYKTTADIYRNMRFLGKILGLEAKANRLADSLENLEKKIVTRTNPTDHISTLVLISQDPIITVGHKSFINEIVTKAGGKNVFGNLDQAYSEITEESILRTNPDVIVMASSDNLMFKKLIDKYPSLTKNVNAIKKDQIYILDPDRFLRPGPRTAEAIGILAQMLHPEISVSDLFETAPAKPAHGEK